MAGFTAVAAGIGLASTAASTGMSFAQAGKQNRLRKEAEAAAEKAMMEARGRTEANYFEQLAVAKESYEQANKASNVAAAQAIEAIKAGDVRGVSAGVGGIQQSSLQQANQVRAAQEKEILDRQKLIAQEDSRLRDINVQLDLQEVQGAQLAARDAQEANVAALGAGFEGLASMGQQTMDMVPLFQEQEGIYFDKKGKLRGSRKAVQEFKEGAAAGQLQIDLDAEAMGLNDPYLDPFDRLKTGKRVGFEGVPKESPLFKKFDKAPEMGSVITNQKEGDAFRGYMNKFHPAYSKKIDLDKTGKFDNKYIKKAYEDFGLDYANYQRGY
jgi:hypothetical protein